MVRDSRPNASYYKYVTSVETSKRLISCGFSGETMFFWMQNKPMNILILYRGDVDYQGDRSLCVSAPTASEIKDKFPLEVWITTTHSLHRRPAVFYYSQYQGKHIVSLMIKSLDTDQVYEVHREEDANEAEAVGRMYCYIIENDMHT